MAKRALRINTFVSIVPDVSRSRESNPSSEVHITGDHASLVMDQTNGCRFTELCDEMKLLFV